MQTKMRKALGGMILVIALALGAGCDDTVSPDGLQSPLTGRTLTQVDRFGLPAINTVFIPSAMKDDYNRSAPSGDPIAFRGFVEAALDGFAPLAVNRPFDSATLASVLQPDVQPLLFAAVPGAALSGFPHGRRLEDDVIDTELFLIFGENAALASDGVDGNDVPFLGVFPYLAVPNTP